LTVLLVTHNPALAGLADRTIELRDGGFRTAQTSKLWSLERWFFKPPAR
jgi:ABC-type lipoprotein export system ATPase subunit